jgi:hypothetical protein
LRTLVVARIGRGRRRRLRNGKDRAGGPRKNGGHVRGNVKDGIFDSNSLSLRTQKKPCVAKETGRAIKKLIKKIEPWKSTPAAQPHPGELPLEGVPSFFACPPSCCRGEGLAGWEEGAGPFPSLDAEEEEEGVKAPGVWTGDRWG